MDPSAVSDMGATWQHPVDILEPEEEAPPTPYQAAAQRMAEGLDHILRKIVSTDHGDAYAEAIAYLFGLPWARKPIEIADAKGIHRETLSAVVTEVADHFGVEALRSVQTRVQASKSRFSYTVTRARASQTTARKNNAIIRRVGAACHVKGAPLTMGELKQFKLSKAKIMQAATSEGCANRIQASGGKVALKGGKKAWETCYRAIPPKSADARAIQAGAAALGKQT